MQNAECREGGVAVCCQLVGRPFVDNDRNAVQTYWTGIVSAKFYIPCPERECQAVESGEKVRRYESRSVLHELGWKRGS